MRCAAITTVCACRISTGSQTPACMHRHPTPPDVFPSTTYHRTCQATSSTSAAMQQRTSRCVRQQRPYSLPHTLTPTATLSPSAHAFDQTSNLLSIKHAHVRRSYAAAAHPPDQQALHCKSHIRSCRKVQLHWLHQSSMYIHMQQLHNLQCHYNELGSCSKARAVLPHQGGQHIPAQFSQTGCQRHSGMPILASAGVADTAV